MSKKLSAKNLLKEVRTLKKLASQDYKEKLIGLLISGDPDNITQALSLNDSLDLLTDQEIGDILVPFIVRSRMGQSDVLFKQYGLGWLILETVPTHSYWDNLTYLDLSENNLISIPKEIGNLKNLRYLNLEGNNLTSLPKEIGNLKNLRKLYLKGNKLTSLPKEIGNLQDHLYLYIEENNLTSLPKEIGNAKRLVHLDLDGNKLISLPKEIGNLKNLQRLYLRGNNLTSLPKEIGDMSDLEILTLEGNPLKSIPEEVIEDMMERGVKVFEI